MHLLASLSCSFVWTSCSPFASSIMERISQLLLQSPQKEAFMQDGRFFKQPAVLEACLKGAHKEPLPTRLALLGMLEEVALDLDLRSLGEGLQEDAMVLFAQWRLRHFARRARRFLLGAAPFEEAKVKKLLKEIRKLRKELKGSPPTEDMVEELKGSPPTEDMQVAVSALFGQEDGTQDPEKEMPAGATSAVSDKTIKQDDAMSAGQDATLKDADAMSAVQDDTLKDDDEEGPEDEDEDGDGDKKEDEHPPAEAEEDTPEPPPSPPIFG